MTFILGVVISYLVGSFSTSFVAGRMLKGIDIRDHGSGNAGATNTLRILGPKVAILVLLIDLFKGVLSVWIGMYLTHSTVMIAMCGVASILGHNWPLYYGFRGGKGAATSIGVAFALSPISAVFSIIMAILLLAGFRFVSLASLTFTISFPVFLMIYHEPLAYIIAAIMVAILSVFRHRENVKRLLSGTERKLGSA